MIGKMELYGRDVFIVHFGELWLRGRNRGEYISALNRNLREATGDKCLIINLRDRLAVVTDDKDKTGESLGHLFGISKFELARVSKPSLQAIRKTAEEMLLGKTGRLRIDAHRSYKELPFDSMDVVRCIAESIEGTGVTPSPRDHSMELSVSITKDHAFLSLERFKGLGGLPVGTSGKSVILLSGGIDSPVAAWYAMKRGAEPIYIHLHAYSDNDEAIASKISDITDILSSYYPHFKAYYLPSHFFQLAALKAGRHELVMLKRFMIMLAEKIANAESAPLIFTGESIGQVASQTPSNLLAEGYGVKLPIIRPLSGMDKEEIISVAKRIGTYEHSIIPYKDVCSINSKNPHTRTSVDTIKKLSAEMGLSRIASRTLKAAKVVER